jgi:hypothetical protein
MRECNCREWGIKETFSCACCRGHLQALWKSMEKTFVGPQSFYMFTYSLGRNTSYAPVKILRGNSFNLIT